MMNKLFNSRHNQALIVLEEQVAAGFIKLGINKIQLEVLCLEVDNY